MGDVTREQVAWALIDPNWGEPVVVVETIRETRKDAEKAAITTDARGVSIYSGASNAHVPPIVGKIDRLNEYGFRLSRITITISDEVEP